MWFHTEGGLAKIPEQQPTGVISLVFATTAVFASPNDKEVDVEKEVEKEQDHHYGPGHYFNHQPVGLFQV